MKKCKMIACFLMLSFAVQAQLNAEQQKIRQTFFSFLKFYQKNEKAFNSFTLYKGKPATNSNRIHFLPEK